MIAGTFLRLVGTSGNVATISPFPGSEKGEVPFMFDAAILANTD